ncbi:MAG: hypothetical protein IJX99_01265 [Clostridia bacterium]|nr:hypothetical protein [Clostridia bacterium]
MAFRGRGGFPGGRRSSTGNSGNLGNKGSRIYRRGGFFSGRPYGRPIYITYNCNAVLVMEVVILLVALFLYLYNFESVYIRDPIEYAKTSFLDVQFGGTLLYTILLLIINALRDVPEKALKCFVGVFVLAIIFCSSVGVAKLNMDNKYTEEKFAEMYSEVYFKDKTNGNLLNISLDGVVKTEANEDIFKRECESLYKSFTLKVMVGFFVQFVLLLLNGYLIIKVAKSKEKFDKAQKENEVLFDEEQNIKV